MRGLPTLTCPECGKSRRTESALRHTAAAWRLAAAACVLLAGAHILSNVPVHSIRAGWWAVAPETDVLLASGLLPQGRHGSLPSNSIALSSSTPFEDELERRYLAQKIPPVFLARLKAPWPSGPSNGSSSAKPEYKEAFRHSPRPNQRPFVDYSIERRRSSRHAFSCVSAATRSTP